MKATKAKHVYTHEDDGQWFLRLLEVGEGSYTIRTYERALRHAGGPETVLYALLPYQSPNDCAGLHAFPIGREYQWDGDRETLSPSIKITEGKKTLWRGQLRNGVFKNTKATSR